MLANHTSIASVRAIFLFVSHCYQVTSLSKLFKRMLDQFDRLRKRNAFLEQYKKEKMFEHGLEEFDDARYVLSISIRKPHNNICIIRATCEELLKEYKACESPDYITYVSVYSGRVVACPVLTPCRVHMIVVVQRQPHISSEFGFSM